MCVMDRTATQPQHVPLIVHSRAEIAKVLADRRRELGETCEDFDHRAGFSDRYVTKLENGGKPGMRQGFHIEPPAFDIDWDRMTFHEGRVRLSAMAEVWLEACGFALVLMDRAQALAIGAVRAPSQVVA